MSMNLSQSFEINIISSFTGNNISPLAFDAKKLFLIACVFKSFTINLMFKSLKLLFTIFLFTIFLQIIIGAFVSGMDAGKIYNTWPLMGNNYFPDDNSFFNLFNLNALSDPSLVQFLHRNLAYVILLIFFTILYFVLNYKLLKFYSIIKILGTILVIQIILGILTILNGAQMLIASMHQISSIALISFSIYFLFLNTKKN